MRAARFLPPLVLAIFASPALAGSAPVSILTWGGLGTAPGSFDHPFGIAIDPSDFIYVADQENNRIQKFTTDGQLVLAWSTGFPSNPTGITVAPNGDILVTESLKHVVTRWNSSGAYLGQIGQGGYTTPGHLVYPVGVATDLAGNVYVGDSENHRIQKFAPDGTWLDMWGSIGPAPGQFNRPFDVEFDGSRLWVSEYVGSRYQAFDTDGNLIQQVGSAGNGDGQFFGAQGSCFIGSGLMFACDTGHHRVQVFANGTWLLSFGEYGNAPNQFFTPTDVAVDSKGDVYVVESNNHRVQKFRVEMPTPTEAITWGTIKDRYRR